MKFLAYQDGRVIYGHLRFRRDGLLPIHDEATAKWIAFTNMALQPSIWSRSKPQNPNAPLGPYPSSSFERNFN